LADGGNHSEPTEAPLLSHLRGLQDAALAAFPSTAARDEALAIKAHFIHKIFSAEDFSDCSVPNWQQLRDCLGFLGRVQSSFRVFVRAAMRLPNFERINISVIERPDHGPRAKRDATHIEEWTLVQVLEYLGCTSNEEQIHRLMGCSGRKTRWTEAKLLKGYNGLKSSVWEVHAEIQLVPSYVEAVATGASADPYIGCGKKSCFLCSHFLDLFANIRTRGCHGKLYHLWGLPNFKSLTAVQIQRIVTSLQQLEDLLKQQILGEFMGVLKPA
jgi:hypothetical protein